jgi:alkaline phosphatase D
LSGVFSSVSLAAFLAGCGTTAGPEPSAQKPLGDLPEDRSVFAHGVASGDPLSDRVILWTRVTTPSTEPVTVRWVLARDAGLRSIVAEGSAEATAESDFTVKVDPTGLPAGTTLYFAFGSDTLGRSPVGRTRTLPTGAVARARVAFTSCANYNNGYFNAYRTLARRADLDLWIHLGDYIYEYADGVYGDTSLGRSLQPPQETVTLGDYRKRYAHYRSDPDLQEVHRQHPILAVWDDHETANDAWRDGAENHQPEEGDWNARKAAATRAFLEWLPVRATDPASLPPLIYRTFPFGNLFDLVLLDTRLVGRDKATAVSDTVNGTTDKGTPEQWADPERTLLGAAQEEWFRGQLSASKARGARWRLIGNQVMFAPVRDPRDMRILDPDMWDGYQATRTRLFDHVKANAIDNLVFLTGDIHSSWALDVPEDPFTSGSYDKATGAGSLAVELVTPSVTSVALEDSPLVSVVADLLKAENPHLKFNEVTRKGYVLVDVTDERIQAEWYFVKAHKTKTDEEELAAAFTCTAGTAHLVEASAPTTARADAPALA